MTTDLYEEHPLAAKLYRRFKAGSDTMTKAEAYDIGNELDRMHRELICRRAKMDATQEKDELMAHMESLGVTP